MEYLAQHIEGLIFTSEHPLSLKDIKSCLEETFETKFKEAELLTAIDQIIERYKGVEFSFEVLSIGGGYQFLTKGAYHQSIGTLLKQNTKKRLSRAALETLSIIAYKQPVTKGELEKIRGVSCDYAVQKLLEKELVTIIGRSEGPGRPLLYGTSQKFMDYFGLNSIADLPKPKDFKAPDSEVGEVAPIEEAVPQAVDVTGVDENGEVEEAITVKIEDAAPGDAIVEPVSDESPTYEASVAIEAEETELLSEAEVLSEIEKGEEGLNHVATDIVAQEEE
ncbi:MAG: SMC-Scp complex subunit ScpB [Bacteroidota bacterium]